MAKGRDSLISILQEQLKTVPALGGSTLTKKDAEAILKVVVDAIEKTLLDNLNTDGFSLKLNKFAKLTVHHKQGILRKIPFNNQTTLTKDKRKVKFVILGKLREAEIVKTEGN